MDFFIFKIKMKTADAVGSAREGWPGVRLFPSCFCVTVFQPLLLSLTVLAKVDCNNAAFETRNEQ